jgi:hypothetical protein
MNQFSERMAKCSNEELLDIVIIKPYEYQNDAVLAAEFELKRRDIPDLDSIKHELRLQHFNDLSDYSDSDLKNYALLLKFQHKKSDKEVHHILKMGNLPAERCDALINSFDDSAKDLKKEASEKNSWTGALWLIGGIVVTIFSFTNAESGGTYFVATGAIVYGLIRMFNLI